MTEILVNFPLNRVPEQHAFRLDKGFKDAVGDYLNRRWPKKTAKEACKAFPGLSLDQAKKAVAYDASMTTVELICKRGGPPVFLPILEEVWGQSIAHFYRDIRENHNANAQRLGALVGDWFAPPPPRHPHSDDVAPAPVERRQFDRRRTSQG